MDISLIQQLISSLGFPIFVAIWFMLKSSKDMQKMTVALQNLERAIQKLGGE